MIFQDQCKINNFIKFPMLNNKFCGEFNSNKIDINKVNANLC